MLERIFSPRGRRVYLITIFIVVGYFFWRLFTNTGLIGWVNKFQAYYIFDGYYYPELTILVFLLPIIVVCFSAGLSYDYFTRQGIFTDYENSPDFAKPDSNLLIDYQATTRKEIIDLVRTRYHEQISQLKLLGFEDFAFYREIVSRFGAPLGLKYFLGMFVMAANEVIRMGPDWTVNAFFPLLVSRRDFTYVYVSNLGTSFYTGFQDGTCLISCTYAGIEIQDDKQKLYKNAKPRSIQTAWNDHKRQMEKFCAEGRAVKEYLNIADYFSLMRRVGDYALHHRVKVSKGPGEETSFVTMITSNLGDVIIFFGIFMSFFFALTFVGNAMSYIYPGCWVVKGLHSDSLLLNFLAIPGCMAVAWFFAHFQNKPFLINGMGTRFYETEPVENTHKYISTKWLVCLGVPLMPVGSYLITQELIQFQTTAAYTFQPVKELNWNQVKETIRKARVRYIIMATAIGLLMIGLIAWPMAKCG